jgi:hypothetical protein
MSKATKGKGERKAQKAAPGHKAGAKQIMLDKCIC